MTGRTAVEAKEEVRNAIDIVQIVGERVPLRRAGRTWKGLCPFHAERTPSFTVNPERQIWHCFGCNRGGDVFSFLMEIDHLTFPEALGALAERAGVELPRGDRGVADPRRERLYQATALANDFFQASLRTEAAAPARAYLAGRGFDSVILERFQIGWAPAGWDGLSLALGKLLPSAVLEEAGLTLRRADGTWYDRFRNRISFPILASAGRVAGFGARAINPEDTPKYLNSPESAIYRKGALLFGLPQARASIRERKRVLICEGYLDAMRLHANGHPNSVCTSGTALTTDQARNLARLEADVVLVYDGDDAGIRAADRALEPLLAAGLAVRVLILPGGEDPDSFLAGQGPQAFEDLLDRAGDAASFLATARLSGSGTNPTPEARVRRYVEVLARVEDPIRRRLLVRRGAVAFGIEEEVLLEALAKPGKSRRGAAPSALPPTAALPEGAGVPPIAAGAPAGGEPGEMSAALRDAGLEGAAQGEAAAEPPDPVERELAARCLTEDGALQEVAEQGGANCFSSLSLRTLLQVWLQMGRSPLPEELRALESMEPLARALLAELPVEEGRTDERSRHGARDLIVRIRERRLRGMIQELDLAIGRAERGRDEGALGPLVAKRRDLASKLHSRDSATLTSRNHPAASEFRVNPIPRRGDVNG